MRLFVLAMLLSLAIPLPMSATAEAATTLTRSEIRAMPIHDRPNRTGHFYGNTVRRRQARSN
jgi:hypothetical protein